MMIVAEISANHAGTLEHALDTIEAAAISGADAVKFQTYNPKLMAKPGYRVQHGPWEGRELVELYEEACTPYEWHETLFDHARHHDLLAFSSVFDSDSLQVLENLDCPIYKISSFELNDLVLIGEVAATGKPMIMSTGMASPDEIKDAVNTARIGGCDDITLLHCVSSYPAHYEDSNLRTLEVLRNRYDVKVGLSDHSVGHTIATIAVALGAEVIEKHFMLPGTVSPDSHFSMLPFEFARLVTHCHMAELAMGEVVFGLGNSEEFRRSLYYAEDLKAGTMIEFKHLKTMRPALGAAPNKHFELVGKILKRDVKKDDPVLLPNG